MPDIPRVDAAEMARLITQNLAEPGSIPSGTEAPPPFDPGPTDTPAPQGEAPVAEEGAPGVAPQSPPPQLAPFDPFDPALNEPGVRVDPSTSRPFIEPTPPTEPAVDTNTGFNDPTTAAPEPTSEPVAQEGPDIGLIYRLALGHDPDPSEVVQTVGLAGRISSLNDQDQALVNAVLNGQLNAAQIEAQLAAAQQYQQQPTTQQPISAWDDDDTLDPRLEAERQALAAERAQIAAQQRAFQEQQIAQIRTQVDGAWEEFQSQHPDWAPEEFTALRVRVDASPIFGAQLNQSGDARSAFLNTIQYEALTHDHFRTKLMAEASSPQQTASEAARTNAAAALAGNGQGSGGGGGARGVVGATPPPRPAPQPGATLPAGALDPALTGVQIPQGFRGAAYDPTTQQPVLPAASPLTNPASDGGAPDLTNRNTQALVMAQEIARLTGGG